MTTTYPVEVELIGTDGNAFALIGKVARAPTAGPTPYLLTEFAQDVP